MKQWEFKPPPTMKPLEPLGWNAEVKRDVYHVMTMSSDVPHAMPGLTSYTLHLYEERIGDITIELTPEQWEAVRNQCAGL